MIANAVAGTKIISPIALASASDGSLFIGDYDVVKRLSPSGEVTKILDLSGFSAVKAYRYVSSRLMDAAVYLALGPRTVFRTLFMS